MRAFKLYEPFKYELVNIPIPSIKDNQVLVRVGAAAICHSDLDMIEGRRTFAINYPAILGHEFAGTVAEVGKDVIGLKEGDKVACECSIWCGVCPNCLHGRTGTCLNYDEYGSMKPGGFAEYVAVNGNMAHKFEKISMDEASNLEPAGNSYHAVKEAGINPGDIVMVIGPGPIGLYALQFAKLKYPGILIMVGTRDDRLGLSKKLGATVTVNVNKEDAHKKIMEVTGGKGVDKTIQCATTNDAVQLAVDTIGVNSTIIIEGVNYGDKKIEFDFFNFLAKTLTIKGVTGAHTTHFIDSLKLMEQGLIDTKRIITHRFPLDRIDEGFDLLKQRKDGVIKVVINP